MDGLQKFFNDIGVEPVDPVTLLISKYMQAKTMGFYTWEEFECGFKSLGAQSIAEFKQKLPSLY